MKIYVRTTVWCHVQVLTVSEKPNTVRAKYTFGRGRGTLFKREDIAPEKQPYVSDFFLVLQIDRLWFTSSASNSDNSVDIKTWWDFWFFSISILSSSNFQEIKEPWCFKQLFHKVPCVLYSAQILTQVKNSFTGARTNLIPNKQPCSSHLSLYFLLLPCCENTTQMTE